MKKLFIMVCAAAALTACGGKQAPSASDVVADTVENTAADTTAAAATEADGAAASAAASVTSALEKNLSSADAKSLKQTVADAKETYDKLVKEGKTEEAAAYASKIKEYVNQNADAIKKVASGDVTVTELINGFVNLPSSVKQSAADAKNAVNADANQAKAAETAAKAAAAAAKSKVESDVKATEAAAKAAAAAKVEEGKQKVRDAANKKVNDVLNKALGN